MKRRFLRSKRRGRLRSVEEHLRACVAYGSNARIGRSRAAFQTFPRDVQFDPKILCTPQTEKIPCASNFPFQCADFSDFFVNESIRMSRPANFIQNGPNTVKIISGCNRAVSARRRFRALHPRRMWFGFWSKTAKSGVCSCPRIFSTFSATCLETQNRHSMSGSFFLRLPR